jgi:hypothetical protein
VPTTAEACVTSCKCMQVLRARRAAARTPADRAYMAGRCHTPWEKVVRAERRQDVEQPPPEPRLPCQSGLLAKPSPGIFFWVDQNKGQQLYTHVRSCSVQRIEPAIIIFYTYELDGYVGAELIACHDRTMRAAGWELNGLIGCCTSVHGDAWDYYEGKRLCRSLQRTGPVASALAWPSGEWGPIHTCSLLARRAGWFNTSLE